MKKILTLISIVCVYGTMCAQQVTPDPRLSQVWDENTIEHHLAYSPTTIQYYNFFLDHAYVIEDFPVDKMDAYENIPELQLKDAFANETPDFSNAGLKNLNIMKYDIEIHSNQRSTYRLGKSGKIIVFYSGYEITSEFNRVRK